MAANPLPENHQAVVAYPIVRGVPSLIEFLVAAFDAEEVHRTKQDDGTVMHAQVRVNDSLLMMGEAGTSHKPMPASLYVYVDDVDRVYHRALKAGAVSVMEPADQFYGDRTGGVKDPVGNVWWIASQLEALTSEELQRRATEQMD